jgi:hypothetical protein
MPEECCEMPLMTLAGNNVQDMSFAFENSMSAKVIVADRVSYLIASIWNISA